MAIPAGDGIMFALRSPAVSFATYHIPSVGKVIHMAGLHGYQRHNSHRQWNIQLAPFLGGITEMLPIMPPLPKASPTMDSFIYVSTKSWYSVEAYEFVPSCGYLAATPLGGPGTTIHHVNVVRLVGFCSEETTRALIYEFMPRGSLDKYIFSLEKSFSWDKLNEIALDGRRAQEC
ncbi:hypothetical protein HU200_020923 [Digitaria exilis]|uniref:Serine-threonine/tyrosine-protein kinase catalytic domain-containing protein n=1 Tax=Digitaria exilis TaxID=1010633 RepID=A0A835F0P0_9POAL|nr:hypothetical protein HU200_020923 [Digitaria exilis]